MICNVCGRNIENENAHFCENCGTKLNENNLFTYQNEYRDSYEKQSSVNASNIETEAMSFKSFLGIMLLQLVPYVGIIILLSWVFGNKYNQTQKNFAKAALVINIIYLLIAAYAIGSGMFGNLGLPT